MKRFAMWALLLVMVSVLMVSGCAWLNKALNIATDAELQKRLAALEVARVENQATAEEMRELIENKASTEELAKKAAELVTASIKTGEATSDVLERARELGETENMPWWLTLIVAIAGGGGLGYPIVRLIRKKLGLGKMNEAELLALAKTLKKLKT